MIDSEQHIREAAYYLWDKWHKHFTTFTDKDFWRLAELKLVKGYSVTLKTDGILLTKGRMLIWYDNEGHIKAMLDNKGILKGTI